MDVMLQKQCTGYIVILFCIIAHCSCCRQRLKLENSRGKHITLWLCPKENCGFDPGPRDHQAMIYGHGKEMPRHANTRPRTKQLAVCSRYSNRHLWWLYYHYGVFVLFVPELPLFGDMLMSTATKPNQIYYYTLHARRDIWCVK